ncbi:hypothetical protein DL96DRAFT_1600161 [Flagelloscypha sp. PMI_526]|nr:hypothetical protein DL96DRAFT_1600161 [Flagelloscypha sp. PMI_526]
MRTFTFAVLAVAASVSATSFPACAENCVGAIKNKFSVDAENTCDFGQTNARSSFLFCASHACSVEEQEQVNQALSSACSQAQQVAAEVERGTWVFHYTTTSLPTDILT